MNLSVYLADYAQGAPGQKAHVIGLGWTKTTTPLPPHAVILLLDLDVEELAQEHTTKVELLNEDGQPARDEEGKAIRIDATFQSNASEGSQPDVVVPIAINIAGGMPLEPGMYGWRVEMNGEHRDGWTRRFTVADPPPPAVPDDSHDLI